MKRLRAIVLWGFSLSLLLFPLAALAKPTDSGHLITLMYHRFNDGVSISTPTNKFKRQINYLRKNNYNFVTLQDVRRHLKNNEPFPEKSVLITIDDGYKSTYTEAYPFLRKHDIPWVLYIYTEAIQREFGLALSWDQIREMARNGATIGNHTYSHDHPTRSSFQSGNWIRREIIGPHHLLERQLEQKTFSFAIPYGEYDRNLLDALEERGNYDVIWGIDPGLVDPAVDQRVLPRFGINRSTTWSDFKDKINRLPLRVKSMKPAPAAPLLASGDTIRITLAHPDRYRKGPINVFFSELGPREWRWSDDGESLIVPVGPELNTHWNRVILTIYDPVLGRYRYFSRGFPTVRLK